MEDWSIRSVDPPLAVMAAMLVLGLLIGLLVLAPWSFADPYAETEHHVITHESTAAFHATVAREEIAVDDPVPIDELSPTAQVVLQDAIADGAPQTDRWGHGSDDWLVYQAAYCREGLPLCDGYEEYPSDFEFGSTLGPDKRYVVVETDTGSYLLDTTSRWPPDHLRGSVLPYPILLKIFVVLPVVAVLTLLVTSARNTHPEVVLGVAAYGLWLTVAGVAEPYLQMYLGLSVTGHGWFVFSSTWAILLVALAIPVRDELRSA